MSDPVQTPAAASAAAPSKPKHDPSAAYFCTVSGVRIVAPGVCKEVDPKNGVDLYVAPAPKKPR